MASGEERSGPQGWDDAELAARLAEGAGRIALAVRGSDVWHGDALGAEGDRMTNAFIMSGLAAGRPDDAILCEECLDTQARLGADRVWIIDPLDGTREYGEGRDDWAVHVALTVDGRAVAAAVALPARGLLLRSDRPTAIRPAGSPLRILVSRTRRPPEAERLAQALGGDLVPMGSAGAKAAAVITGEADIYLHSGGQNQWDNCAPVGVALAVGLHAARLDGCPIRYNQAETLVPDLLICRPELVERVHAVLG